MPIATQSAPDDPMAYTPAPEWVPAREGHVQLRDSRLWVSDTGGDGPPLILLHPAAGGNPSIWRYQQPVFAKAGYRVICYARRGYYKSDPASNDKPGNAADDLRDLIAAMGLPAAHIVSSAAGGSVAADHALSYPQQVRTLTVSSNYAGVREGYIWTAAQRARVPQWNALPRWYREFCASYIVANPQGIEAWTALQDEQTKGHGVEQATNHVITGETLEGLRMPTLLLTGDADSSTPPSLMRMLARHIAQAELVIVPESGHSPYWERPTLFNEAVLDFLGRH